MSSHRESIHTAAPDAQLVPLGGSRGGSGVIPLAKALTLVGSGSGVHLCLQTRTVEEFHAAILNCDGQVYLRDLGTLGGTMVNGQRVRGALLRNGDEIQFGKVGFHFQSRAPMPQNTNATPAEPGELRVGNRGHGLSDRVMLIGRGPRCDLRLDDDLCFDKHAIVYSAAGEWQVRILTPGPGTLLNERSVRRATLSQGDVLQVGRTQIVYHVGQTEPTPVEDAPPAVERKEPEPLAQSNAVEPIAAVKAEVAAAKADTIAAHSATEQPEFFRGWGPVAAALATAHELEPDQDETSFQEPPPRARRNWLIAGVIIGVVVVAASAVAVLFIFTA